MLALLNWSAVSRVKDEAQSCQAQCLGVLLNRHKDAALGVYLSPQFGYRKGQLYLAEHACLKRLNSVSINVDTSMMLQFASKLDCRDTRPLCYNGRLLTGLDYDGKSGLFQKSKLCQEGRTEAAEQLLAANMAQVEDMHPEAAPNAVLHVTGARKFEQIGCSGWRRVIEAAFDGSDLGAGHGAVVIDLNLSVGDSFDAWLEKRASYEFPVWYVGLTDDVVTKEWFEKTKHEVVTTKHLENKLQIPGCKNPDAEIPEDLLPKAPAMPELSVLLPCGEKKMSLGMPDWVAQASSLKPMLCVYMYSSR